MLLYNFYSCFQSNSIWTQIKIGYYFQNKGFLDLYYSLQVPHVILEIRYKIFIVFIFTLRCVIKASIRVDSCFFITMSRDTKQMKVTEKFSVLKSHYVTSYLYQLGIVFRLLWAHHMADIAVWKCIDIFHNHFTVHHVSIDYTLIYFPNMIVVSNARCWSQDILSSLLVVLRRWWSQSTSVPFDITLYENEAKQLVIRHNHIIRIFNMKKANSYPDHLTPVSKYHPEASARESGFYFCR